MKLLFDCDGTILDSMHIWVDPINEIFEKYGFRLDTLSKEEKGKIEALPLDGMCEFIADELAEDMSKEDVREYFDEIINDGYKNSLMPKDGALKKLQELHEKGYEMAIASSTDSIYLKLAFERLNIDQYFSFLTTPDLADSKKSEKEYWQYAIDQFGVDANEVILYDDALYAIKSANAVGINTCGVKDFPYNENEWEDIKENATLYLNGIWEIDADNLLGK
ncbi:HAD family hydrolase [Anaerococcus sp. ENR0831]|uniref:HAD family hydrolase n=1 Tax=Anaerococcus martiniensis TaxID=3115615 RepID=A0ABW9M7H6_9FIRM